MRTKAAGQKTKRNMKLSLQKAKLAAMTIEKGVKSQKAALKHAKAAWKLKLVKELGAKKKSENAESAVKKGLNGKLKVKMNAMKLKEKVQKKKEAAKSSVVKRVKKLERKYARRTRELDRKQTHKGRRATRLQKFRIRRYRLTAANNIRKQAAIASKVVAEEAHKLGIKTTKVVRLRHLHGRGDKKYKIYHFNKATPEEVEDTRVAFKKSSAQHAADSAVATAMSAEEKVEKDEDDTELVEELLGDGDYA